MLGPLRCSQQHMRKSAYVQKQKLLWQNWPISRSTQAAQVWTDNERGLRCPAIVSRFEGEKAQRPKSSVAADKKGAL